MCLFVSVQSFMVILRIFFLGDKTRRISAAIPESSTKGKITMLNKSKVFIALAMGFLSLVTAMADPTSQVGRLSYVSGSVSFNPGSIDEWTPASLNYPLSGGDQLWTAVGARAEVQLRSASVRLDSGTAFSFLDLEDQMIRLRLSQGSLYVDLRALDQGSIFEIDTPNAALSLVTAGKYRIDVSSRGETRIVVREGWAEVDAEGYVQNLNSGQSAILSGSNGNSFSMISSPRSDGWESWCGTRDSLEDRALSDRRLSQDMIGAADLGANGTWAMSPAYGQVWTPSRLPAGWAPYRFGHWSWDEPWGWTWIDDASWGFAPFHYGRWIYLGDRWAWIPGAPAQRPVYAPALVVFIGGSGWNHSGGESIGWVALGPGEVYIPPYQASVSYIQSINISCVTNINVQIIQNYAPERIAYANRGMPRGMTIVPREAFVSSRPTRDVVIDVDRTEASRAPFMGMTAAIAPRRESIMARAPAAATPIAQPPSALNARPVVSRQSASPAPVPFAQQQGALAQNPGRPLAPADIATIRQRQNLPAPLPVRVLPQQAPNANNNSAGVVPQASAPRGVAPQKSAPQAPVPQASAQREAAPQKSAPQVPAPAPSAASSNGAAVISLIATLKGSSFPDAEKRLSDARKVAGIQLDFNSISSGLATLKQALAQAEQDTAAKNYDKALQSATSIRDRLAVLVNEIEAAVRRPAPAQTQSPAQAPVQSPRRTPGSPPAR